MKMRVFLVRNALLALLSLIVALPQALSQTSPADQGQKFLRFFSNLGFRDWTAPMAEALRRDRDEHRLTTIQRQTLEMSHERYQVYNDARELAIKILMPLYSDFSPKRLQETIELTARQIGLKPVPPPRHWPNEIAAMPEETEAEQEKKDEARIEFVKMTMARDISSHTLRMASDIVEAIYGKGAVEKLVQIVGDAHAHAGKLFGPNRKFLDDIKEIYGRTHNLVSFLYLDGELGDNLLGQALALGMTKAEMDLFNAGKVAYKAVTGRLIKATAAQGERFRDYVGDTVRFIDGKRGPQDIKFVTGMAIAERAAIYPRESAQLAWAARPGSLQNWIQAFRLKLVGWPWNMFLGTEESGDHPVGLIKMIKYKLQWLPSLNRGLSHAGWTYVFEDPETGIKSAKAIDIYPGLVHGGVRIVRLGKFAQRGINMRFAAIKYDAKVMRALAREQIERGSIDGDMAWDGLKEFTDEKGGTLKDAPRIRQDWPYLISREEVMHRFNKYTDDQAEEWYLNEIIRPTADLMIKFMTTYGVAFAEDFTNFHWRSYCSKFPALAVKMATRFDLQATEDIFNVIAQAANEVDLAPGDPDLDQRIVAPSGLFWQMHPNGTLRGESLGGYINIVDYPNDGGFEPRIAMQFREPQPELEKQTSKALKALNVAVGETQIDEKFIDDADTGLVYRVDRAINSHFEKQHKTHDVRNRAGVQGGDGYVSCTALLEDIRLQLKAE